MNDQSTSELDFIKGLLIDAIRAADAIPKPALNLWFAASENRIDIRFHGDPGGGERIHQQEDTGEIRRRAR